jgi:hypothetical protein
MWRTWSRHPRRLRFVLLAADRTLRFADAMRGDPRSLPGKIIVGVGLTAIAAHFVVGTFAVPLHDTPTYPVTATMTCVMTHYAVGVPCFVAP